MNRTLGDLKMELLKRGMTIPESGTGPGGKLARRDMVKMLANYHLDRMEKKSWGLLNRFKYPSPAVCFGFKNLKPEEKQHIMDSDRWIAEQKFDGCRLWMMYSPEEGITFFSRNISVEDYLPVDYTDTLLLIKDGKVSHPKDFIGVWKQSFILDCEVVTECRNLDTTLLKSKGVVTGSELNAVSALLALNPKDSHQVQQAQAQLIFEVFDIIEIGGHEVWKQPLWKRKEMLSKVMEKLQPILPVKNATYVSGKDKEAFYAKCTGEGKEGIVLKNLDGDYQPTDNRNRHSHFIKRKRSVAETQGGDIDAFITGFVPATKGKGWENLIGAIEVSVFLTDEDGGEEEHMIASISAIPMIIREQMTINNPTTGQPELNPTYLGKVVTINGQDISAKAMRFMHATADWKIGIREDKTKHDCLMSRKFLLSQVF